jgi:Asp-tRNA(Asn)/Glu-tRNA(Gln) amidotransferase A subunit family amidase
LHGLAGIWWSHYCSTLPPNVKINCDQFKAAFHGNYIPLGLMAMKHTEFMKLTQGNKSLAEYLQAFNNLARYATEFIDTDAKKITSFKRGLSPKLMKTIGTSKCATFNEFISDALTQENNNSIYASSKSCKRAFEADASQSRALVAPMAPSRPPATGAKFCPP